MTYSFAAYRFPDMPFGDARMIDTAMVVIKYVRYLKSSEMFNNIFFSFQWITQQINLTDVDGKPMHMQMRSTPSGYGDANISWPMEAFYIALRHVNLIRNYYFYYY